MRQDVALCLSVAKCLVNCFNLKVKSIAPCLAFCRLLYVASAAVTVAVVGCLLFIRCAQVVVIASFYSCRCFVFVFSFTLIVKNSSWLRMKRSKKVPFTWMNSWMGWIKTNRHVGSWSVHQLNVHVRILFKYIECFNSTNLTVSYWLKIYIVAI